MKKRIVSLVLLLLVLAGGCRVRAQGLHNNYLLADPSGFFAASKSLYRSWLQQKERCSNPDAANEAICVVMNNARSNQFLRTCANGFGGYMYGGQCPLEECPDGYALYGQCPNGAGSPTSNVYAQAPLIYRRDGTGMGGDSAGYCADIWNLLKGQRSYSGELFMSICMIGVPPGPSPLVPQQLIDDLNSIRHNLYSFTVYKHSGILGECNHFQCYSCTNFTSCDEARKKGYCPDCHSTGSLSCALNQGYTYKQITNSLGTIYQCATGCVTPNFNSCSQARTRGYYSGVYDAGEMSCGNGARYRQITNNVGRSFNCVTGCNSTPDLNCPSPTYGDQQHTNYQCHWVPPVYKYDENGEHVLDEYGNWVVEKDGYWEPCCEYAGCNERPDYKIAACVYKVNQKLAEAGKDYGIYQQYCGNNSCNRDGWYGGVHYYPRSYYYPAYCRRSSCPSPLSLKNRSDYFSTCDQDSNKGNQGGVIACEVGQPTPWDPRSAGAYNTGSCYNDPSEICYATKTCQQNDPGFPSGFDPNRSDGAYFDPDNYGYADPGTGYRCGRYANPPAYPNGWFVLSGSNSALEANSAGKSKPIAGCSAGIAYEDLFRPSTNMNVRISAGVRSDQTVTYESLRGQLGEINPCSDPTNTDDGIRVCETSGSVNSSELPTGDNLVVFVNGDLRINGNITASANTFKAIVVKGKLTVNADVGNNPLALTDRCPGANTPAHLQGIFLAQEVKFERGPQPDAVFNPQAYCDKQLVIDGTLAQWQGEVALTKNFRGCVAYGDFNTDYTLFPTYIIHARPSFVTHTPPWFQSIFSQRTEVN